jgi:hypothetical protein
VLREKVAEFGHPAALEELEFLWIFFAAARHRINPSPKMFIWQILFLLFFFQDYGNDSFCTVGT